MTSSEALSELISYAPEYSSSICERHQYTAGNPPHRSRTVFDLFVHPAPDLCEIFTGPDLSDLVHSAKAFIDSSKLLPPVIRL